MPLHDVRGLVWRESNSHKLGSTAVNRKCRALERLEVKPLLNLESLVCGTNTADAFDCEGANGALSMLSLIHI